MSTSLNRAAEGFNVDRYNAARAYLYVLKPWWARFGNKFTLTPTSRPSLGDLNFGAIGTTDRNFRIYLDRDFVSRSPLESIAGSIEFFYQMHAREIYTRLTDVPLDEWDKWASIAFSLEINGAIERENEDLTSEKIMRVLVRSRLFTEADAEKFDVQGPPSTREIGGWFPSDLSLPSDLTAEKYFEILKSLNFAVVPPESPHDPQEDEQDPDIPSLEISPNNPEQDDEEAAESPLTQPPDTDEAASTDVEGDRGDEELPDDQDEGDPGTGPNQTQGEGEGQGAGDAPQEPESDSPGEVSLDGDSAAQERSGGQDYLLDESAQEAIEGEGGEPVGVPQEGEGGDDQAPSPRSGQENGEVDIPDAQGVEKDPDRQQVAQPVVDPSDQDLKGEGNPSDGEVSFSEHGEEEDVTQATLAEVARRFQEKMSDEASQMWSSVAANPDDPLAEAALPPKHERSNGLPFVSKGALLETLEADIVAYHSSTKDLGDFTDIDESLVSIARKRRRAKGLSLEAVLSKELSGSVNGVKSSGAADMSFSVRNPNQGMFGPILMGLHDYAPRVAIVLDVSASMFTDDRSVRSIAIFNEVTAKITARYSCDVTWIAVNDKVAAVGKSRFADIDVLRSLASRGGTNFGHVLHALASGKMTWEGKRVPKPDIVCVITDCGFRFPKRPPVRFVFVSVAPPKAVENYIPEKFFRPGELIFASDLVF